MVVAARHILREKAPYDRTNIRELEKLEKIGETNNANKTWIGYLGRYVPIYKLVCGIYLPLHVKDFGRLITL